MPDSDNEPQALKEVLEGLALSQRPQRTEGAETGDDAPHAFWDTQPVLIKEITRRVNRRGLFQATYTAGVVLPKPVAKCRYWHRSLNPKKLIEFKIAPLISLAEFKHWMLTQTGVIYSYVVEDPVSKELTDMVSFYALPSSILGNDKHKTLCAAYAYYYYHTATPLAQLMNDALVLAKRLDFDVFNALDILQNETFLKELKFGIGDGNLQYYLYNWRAPFVQPRDVGLVLL
eukprot:jgi/Chrpa1/7607/Chrysochromulina_OHIO_Genome00003646-RA